MIPGGKRERTCSGGDKSIEKKKEIWPKRNPSTHWTIGSSISGIAKEISGRGKNTRRKEGKIHLAHPTRNQDEHQRENWGRKLPENGFKVSKGKPGKKGQTG